MRPGTTLTLFNGDGRNYQGQLIECTRNSALVTGTGRSGEERLPAPVKINLGWVLSKGERMDFAIQNRLNWAYPASPAYRTRYGLKYRRNEWRIGSSIGKRVVIAAVNSPEDAVCRISATPAHWTNGCYPKAFSGIGILLDHRAETTLGTAYLHRRNRQSSDWPGRRSLRGERSQAQTAGFESVRLGPA